MGWRKKMGVTQEKILSDTLIQKVQNIQKGTIDLKTKPFALSVPFAPKNQKVKTLQEQINILWNQADKLADWIDDSSSTVPWKERAAKVPELQEKSLEIDRLKAKQTNGVTVEKIKCSTPSQKNAAPSTHVVESNPLCPAKCKSTGKCYGIAYFDAKPGKALLCIPGQCSWNADLQQRPSRKED